MYIVLIEDIPSHCMDDLRIERFETEEEANEFVNNLRDEEKLPSYKPTKLIIYKELQEVLIHSNLFDNT